MATYPSFSQLAASSVDLLDDRQVVRDTIGTARIASFYAGPKRSFTVRHLLDATDLATLRMFYGANRNVAFDFQWCEDVATTPCCFGPRGVSVRLGAVHHDVTVDIVEV